MSSLDRHYLNYLKVAENQYFVVEDVSSNEIQGLLVGTEVRRVSIPECRPSKYWNGLYYSVLVECPNGEPRRLGCDVLTPRKTDKHFQRQAKLYKRQT